MNAESVRDSHCFHDMSGYASMAAPSPVRYRLCCWCGEQAPPVEHGPHRWDRPLLIDGKKCPSCGAENPAHLWMCWSCHTALIDGGA